MLALARRVLPQVREALDLSVYLAALDGGHVVYLLRDMPESGLVSSVKVGSRMAANLATPGRILLAWQEADALDALFVQEPLAQLTAAERKRLRAAMLEDRERGCAWSFSGLEQGINACAAPVFDARGKAVAAISVAGPEMAFAADGGLQERAETQVISGARELSALLGHRA
jgi:DNA-binding IclR family transcriptional regulator